MTFIDRLGSGTLFIVAILECMLVPKTYVGRIWIFGTGLALLFTAMLNLLRIRNGAGVRGLRLFCIAANSTMLMLAIALVMSIGRSRTVANPHIPLIGVVLLVETVFSLRKRA